MIRSSSSGTCAFRRTGATGSRVKIASRTSPVLSPENGRTPVAISYKTAPNE